MNIKIAVLLIVFSVSVCSIQAQYIENKTVIINSDPRIEQLLDLHIAYNKEFPFIDGYRIQLMMQSGNTALDEADIIKKEFEEIYPQIDTYVTFREPYYRLRVGDFRTRLEAMEFLENIRRKYPQAWVIKDKILFPELTKY